MVLTLQTKDSASLSGVPLFTLLQHAASWLQEALVGAFDLILFFPESEALGVYSIRVRWGGGISEGDLLLEEAQSMS